MDHGRSGNAKTCLGMYAFILSTDAAVKMRSRFPLQNLHSDGFGLNPGQILGLPERMGLPCGFAGKKLLQKLMIK